MYPIGFMSDCVQMLQRLRDGQRVHFTPNTFAGLQGFFQKVAGNRDGKRIGDDLSRLFLVFSPCGQRERDPDRSSVDQELDVDGVGMACRDGDYQRLINAVDILFRPTIKGLEIAIHEQ